MKNTTNGNENTEQNEKPRETLYVANLELRDYFAGQVAGHLLVAATKKTDTPDLVARACYMMADAMIAERNKAK